MDDLKKLFAEAFSAGSDNLAYKEGYLNEPQPDFEDWYSLEEKRINNVVVLKNPNPKYKIRKEILNMPWDNWERFPKGKTVIHYTIEAFNKRFPEASSLSALTNEEEKIFFDKLYEYRNKIRNSHHE